MKGFIGSKLVLKLATLVVLIGAIVISLAGPITHSHAASASSQASWNIVPSPNSNQFGINSINSIAHVSANDIWAVGDSIDQSNRNNSQPLIEHWDGTSWSIVASPNPNTINVLNGITAISSNDIWAVGYTNPGSNTQTLTEHWDGTSWSIVASGTSANFEQTLSGVSAVSSNDVWAAGYSNEGFFCPCQALIKHGTNGGNSWTEVPISGLSDFSTRSWLYGITAVSTEDLLAVGTYVDSNNSSHPLIVHIHFDGTIWTATSSSSSMTTNGALNSITAVSASDIWAVGNTLLLHYDGTNWNIVPYPTSTDDYPSTLNAVTAVSSNNIWAVGMYQGQNQGQTFFIQSYSPTPPPTGKWLSPSNGFTARQGSNVTLSIQADPSSGGLPVKQVNINAWWKGVDPKNWTPIATVTTPDSGTTDHYTYKWDFKVGGSYLPETPVEFSFDVVDQGGNTADRPNGVREGMFVPKTAPNPTGPYVTLTVTPQALVTNPTVCVDNLTFSVKNATADELRVSDNGTFVKKLSGSETTYTSSPLGWGSTGYDLYEVMALQSNHFLALTRTYVIYAGTACADGIKTPAAPLPPLPDSQNDLFVVAGGINTSLPNDAQDALGGNGYGYNAGMESYGTVVGNLVWQGYRDSHIIVYSYTGDNGDGAPAAYGCQDTWHNVLQDDAYQMGKQIADAVAGNPNVRVHLIVHSLAGAVGHEYVAAMLYGLYSVPTIPWSQFKDITILDSPFGGMTNNSAYLGWLVTVEHFICSGYSPANSYAQLEQQMQSATDPKHLGTTAKHFTLDLGDSSSIPNQQIADDARSKGVTFNVIGNLRDYLVQPQGCGGGPNFRSTMFDTERGDGSGEYSRAFSSGQTSCSSSALNNGLNHGDVLHNSNVNKWVAQIVMGVPVPVGLNKYTG